MVDLYDQRIDAMKARERNDSDIGRLYWHMLNEISYNAERLAAYKRKRAECIEIDIPEWVAEGDLMLVTIKDFPEHDT